MTRRDSEAREVAALLGQLGAAVAAGGVPAGEYRRALVRSLRAAVLGLGLLEQPPHAPTHAP